MRRAFTRFLGLMALVAVFPLAAVAEIGTPLLSGPVDSVAIEKLLVSIGRAHESVSYSGIHARILTHKGKSIEFRWREYHWQPKRTLVSFIAPEEMAGTQFILQGDQARRSIQDDQKKKPRYYHHARRLFKNGRIFREIALLRQNYRIRAEPGQSFLGRPTIFLAVTPRYPGRPLLEVVVDAETGLLLRTKRLPNEGAAEDFAEISEFSDLSYGEPDPTLFATAWDRGETIKRRRRSRSHTDLTTLVSEMETTILRPNRLPQGFVLRRIKTVLKDDKAFLHFLYGDGLTVVSLFQQKSKSAENQHKNPRRHQAPFSIVRGTHGDISYSVAGEIPKSELEEIAASLQPVHPPRKTWRNLPWYLALAMISISLFTYAAKRKREKLYA
ncbi:MucB/RseB C-terminal domain-containing protein [bacterium]|nr:MucB/RseB C-terminal domain-containing protein [bacterium]